MLQHQHICDVITTVHLSCVTVGGSQHPLVEKWKESQNQVDLLNEIKPILDEAIDQPEALTSPYTTSLFTQVCNKN